MGLPLKQLLEGCGIGSKENEVSKKQIDFMVLGEHLSGNVE